MLTSKTPITDFYNGVFDYIEDYLPARITEINQVKNDSVVLQQMKKYIKGYKGGLNESNYPVAMVFSGYFEFEEAGNRADEADNIITVLIILTGNNEEIITEKLMRYGDAIRNTVLNDETFGGLAAKAYTGKIEPVHPSPVTNNKGLISVEIEIEAEILNTT